MIPRDMLMKAARYIALDGASLDADEAADIALFLANMAGQWDADEARKANEHNYQVAKLDELVIPC